MPDSQNIHDYHEVAIKVRADGVPTPTVKWFNGKTELTNEILDEKKQQRFIILETNDSHQCSNEIIIKHFGPSDCGDYRVVAINIAGETEAKFNMSLLQLAPTFIKKPERVANIDEGQKLEIKALLDGSPIPVVQWFKNGEPISPEDKR